MKSRRIFLRHQNRAIRQNTRQAAALTVRIKNRPPNFGKKVYTEAILLYRRQIDIHKRSMKVHLAAKTVQIQPMNPIKILHHLSLTWSELCVSSAKIFTVELRAGLAISKGS